MLRPRDAVKGLIIATFGATLDHLIALLSARQTFSHRNRKAFHTERDYNALIINERNYRMNFADTAGASRSS